MEDVEMAAADDLMFKGIYNGRQCYVADIPAVHAHVWSAGVDRIVVTGGSLEDSREALAIAETDGRLFCTVGVHPMRCKICDVVTLAGLLNATLVIPIFHLNSVWRDSSNFGEFFDEGHFIETLQNHVRVVKELPEDILQRFDNNISNIVNMRTKALSSKTYYLQKVLPKLLELGYKLAFTSNYSSILDPVIENNYQLFMIENNYQLFGAKTFVRIFKEDDSDLSLSDDSKKNTKIWQIPVNAMDEEGS